MNGYRWTVQVALGGIGLLALLPFVFALPACAGSTSPNQLTESEVEAIKTELADRSFRQFVPHIDGNPRKSVILSFFEPFALWAQYAEDGYAVNEWEIVADDFTVERDGSGKRSVVTLHPINPRTSQQFPIECRDCINNTAVSVSVRNLFDRDQMEFRVNDPEGTLPAPFPVFGKWTKFHEDEIAH